MPQEKQEQKMSKEEIENNLKRMYGIKMQLEGLIMEKNADLEIINSQILQLEELIKKD